MSRYLCAPSLLFAAMLLVMSCGDTDVLLAALGGECVLDSDCDGELVCAFRRCHQACATSADCASEERCVSAETLKVCRLEVEATCSRNSDCPAPLVCGADGSCRNACQTDVDCLSDERCGAEHVCLWPSEPGAASGLGEVGSACLRTSECAPPALCISDRCALECDADADCASLRCVDHRCAERRSLGVSCVPGAQQACTCPDMSNEGVWLCDATGELFGPDCLGCPGVPPTTDCPPMPPIPDSALLCTTALPFSAGALFGGVQVTSSGAVVVSGNLQQVTDFGGGFVLTPVGMNDSYVAFYDGSTCAVQNVVQLSSAGQYVTVWAAQLEPTSQELWLAGTYTGTPDLGTGTLPGPKGVFLARLDLTGAVISVTGWPTVGVNNVSNVKLALSSQGAVVAGTYEGTLDVMGQLLTKTSNVANEMFLVRVDASSQLVSALALPAANANGTPITTGVALAPDDSVVLTGIFSGDTDFGGTILSASTPSWDMFVAAYDPTGALLWVTPFDGPGGASVSAQWLGVTSAAEIMTWGFGVVDQDFGVGPLAMGGFSLTQSIADGSVVSSVNDPARPLAYNAADLAVSQASLAMGGTSMVGDCTVTLPQSGVIVSQGPLGAPPTRVRAYSHPNMAGYVAAQYVGVGPLGDAALIYFASPSATIDFGSGPATGSVFLVHMAAPP